jgi:hypothetical protein
MKKTITLILTLLLLLTSVSFAAETTFDKVRALGKMTGIIKRITITAGCTIGTDCDGTNIDIARGGIILVTTNAASIVLPEVADVPSSIQVPVGASLCIVNKTDNKVITIHPHSNDCITYDGTKGTAGTHVLNTVTASTGGGDFICLVALENDNWYVMGKSGTWAAE